MLTVTKHGDLSGVVSDLRRSAAAGQRDAARAVAQQAPRMVLDDVQRSRGSLRMMGGTLGVDTSTTTGVDASNVELRADPPGAWTIVTKGTKAYTIRPSRRSVLVTASGLVLGTTARRPRRAGRDYWTAATERLGRSLDPVVFKAVDAQMLGGR